MNNQSPQFSNDRLQDLAKQAAEFMQHTLDPDTIAKRKKKKTLSIIMLVLNVLALISLAIGLLADISVFTLLALALAVASFIVSRICKRI